MEAVEPLLETVEPPVETVEPPVETVEPPIDNVEPPVETGEPPVETVEPPVDNDGDGDTGLIMTPGILGLMTGGSTSFSSSEESIGMSKTGSKLSLSTSSLTSSP